MQGGVVNREPPGLAVLAVEYGDFILDCTYKVYIYCMVVPASKNRRIIHFVKNPPERKRGRGNGESELLLGDAERGVEEFFVLVEPSAKAVKFPRERLVHSFSEKNLCLVRVQEQNINRNYGNILHSSSVTLER